MGVGGGGVGGGEDDGGGGGGCDTRCCAGDLSVIRSVADRFAGDFVLSLEAGGCERGVDAVQRFGIQQDKRVLG